MNTQLVNLYMRSCRCKISGIVRLELIEGPQRLMVGPVLQRSYATEQNTKLFIATYIAKQ